MVERTPLLAGGPSDSRNFAATEARMRAIRTLCGCLALAGLAAIPLGLAPTTARAQAVCSDPPWDQEAEPGADGDGVTPGQPGDPGASHLCEVEAQDSAVLETRANDGGSGGWGGFAPPGADAPAGGAGGRGGAAATILELDHAGEFGVTGSAEALAGNGGYGGGGGEASDGGAPGANATGGDGGSALADVNLRVQGTREDSGVSVAANAAAGSAGPAGTSSQAVPGPGARGGDATTRIVAQSDARTTAESVALAGDGGSGFVGGRGGDANVSVRLTTESDRAHIRTVRPSFPGAFFGGAHAGSGGSAEYSSEPDLSVAGDGGNATSETIATALGDSEVSIEDRAVGGDSGHGGIAGDGGDAVSRAVGSNQGSAPVSVRAAAGSGSAFSLTGRAGAARASAHGESLHGDVSVVAEQSAGSHAYIPGPDSVMVDAVTGRTSGTLTLQQFVVGGAGGSPYGSDERLRGGDGISTLNATNSGGGDLVAESWAGGGSGGVGGTGTASAIGRVSGAASVTARALAGGGSATSSDTSGRNGGRGGDASIGAVVAEASGSGDATAYAEAVGGAGGSGSIRGGDGADATLVDAVRAASKQRATLVQRARGGSGGRGGQAGSPGDAVSRLLSGDQNAAILELRPTAVGGTAGAMAGPGRAPDGGTAFAEVGLLRSRGETLALARADGGAGGSATDTSRADAGDGADARVEVRATSEADGATIAIGAASDPSAFGAVGGRGGNAGHAQRNDVIVGSGGDATSRSEAIARGDSRVEVYDRAVGGNAGGLLAGSGTGAAGGFASSIATGGNAGAQPVVVRAEATGGNAGQLAGTAADGAAALTSARGTSTGGGDVSVTSIQTGGSGGFATGSSPRHAGSGGTIVAMNTVSGSTAGTLRLVQRAVGGSGGALTTSVEAGNRGGEASSTLDAMNPGGGELAIVVEAVGGQSGPRVTGASAFASAVGTSAAELAIEARAVGGAGGSNGVGGVGVLGTVHGTGTGGARVDVLGEARGGDAPTGGTSTPSATGGSIALLDAVDGETSGELRLLQRAVGGNARGGVGTIRAGDARSALARERSASDLLVRSEAMGGNLVDENQRVAAAGNADASASARNAEGSATAEALAVGGQGAGVVASQERGSAVAFASAETEGDGHDVRVGVDPLPADRPIWNLPSELALTTGAQGGAGAAGQNGGSARSRSIGVALGSSHVDVVDVARGGRPRPFEFMRHGGSATSTAEGSAAGGEPVRVRSIALGGPAANTLNFPIPPPDAPSGIGGDASASASASGAGQVEARASAVAGPSRSSLFVPFPFEPNTARASAMASAEGGSGEAIAETAHESLALFGRNIAVAARAEADVFGSARAGAASVLADDVAAAVALDAFAGVTSQPSATLLATALSGNPFLASQSGVQNTLALARFEAANARAESGALALRADFDVLVSSLALSPLFVGFLNPELGDSVPDLLRVLIERDGVVEIDEELRDSDAIVAFFSDHALNLAPSAANEGRTHVHVSIELEAADAALGDVFGAQLLVAYGVVPEPGTGVLLLVGLCMVARLRRTPRYAPR